MYKIERGQRNANLNFKAMFLRSFKVKCEQIMCSLSKRKSEYLNFILKKSLTNNFLFFIMKYMMHFTLSKTNHTVLNK